MHFSQNSAVKLPEVHTASSAVLINLSIYIIFCGLLIILYQFTIYLYIHNQAYRLYKPLQSQLATHSCLALALSQISQQSLVIASRLTSLSPDSQIIDLILWATIACSAFI
ncbi:hypothetical protein FGO68_gene4507 [Halteria grandinella]|uniref:Uncharacterized protein n=1 Tax=Halteria grandinella TaxID=5974 RepID=A0A8J8T6A5_HALGN|nr:hypothetical protein FGO68_gene4507 [Halteria grandinella]